MSNQTLPQGVALGYVLLGLQPDHKAYLYQTKHLSQGVALGFELLDLQPDHETYSYQTKHLSQGVALGFELLGLQPDHEAHHGSFQTNTLFIAKGLLLDHARVQDKKSEALPCGISAPLYP